MSFNVGDVLNETIDRLTTQAGAVIAAALTVIGIVQTAATQDIIRGMLEWFLTLLEDPEFREQLAAEDAQELEAAEREITAYLAELPLSLGLSPGMAALLWLVMFVLSLVVAVIAIDTFASRRDTITGIETPRIGWKTGNLFLGWIAFAILFVIGMILFVIPGVLVAIFLVFFAAAIVIDDRSFPSAFAASFGVVRNNIVGTLVIVILTLGIFIGLSIVDGAFGAILPDVVSILLGNLLTGIGQTVAIALVALAYANATADDEPAVDVEQTNAVEP